MKNDLRFALRLLVKSPGFAFVAIVTLALGIGANTSIFTVANTVLLRPLPYANPDRLLYLSLANQSQGVANGVFSLQRYNFIRDHSKSFQSVAAFTNESFNLTDPGNPEQLSAARVSANFFHTLGVNPAIGRVFFDEEDKPSGKPVVLISHSFWMRHFNGSPAVLGQTLNLNTQPFTIIGVTPPGFQFSLLSNNIDVWAPRVFDLNLATPQQIQGGAGFLNAVALLKPSISRDQAQAEMNVLNQQYQHENPALPDADAKNSIAAAGLREQLVANIRPAVLILFGAVGLVLLIACANVASLLLSRALGRRKEIAIRTALGASRGTLIRQLLIESVVISLIGGALGVAASIWTTRALGNAARQSFPQLGELHVDTSVLIFSVAVSLVTGILFGLMPALETSRVDLNTGLRDESRGSTGGRGRIRLRSALVIAQVALAVLLLIGSGLLIRSFIHLLNVSPGVDTTNVLTMRIALPPARYTANDKMVQFFDQLVQRAAAIPGVRSAAVASALPLSPTRFSPALLEGQPNVPLAQRPLMTLQMVSPAYFQTMRTPLLSGRAFNEHDDVQAPLVAIVNQTLARRYWPNQDAIGKKIYLGRLTTPMLVVGVAGDIKNQTLTGGANPEIDMPYAQRPWRTMHLILRSNADPELLANAARQQVAAIDKDQPVTSVQTLDDVFAESRTQPRLIMLLLGLFSGAAFLLAAIGLYGTLSYLVAQRTQELGIRIALGAGTNDILALVVRQGMTITLIGTVIGLVLSLALTRLLSNLLFNVSGTDPITYLAAALFFAAVAFLATYIPARRATRVDPTLAMRAS